MLGKRKKMKEGTFSPDTKHYQGLLNFNKVIIADFRILSRVAIVNNCRQQVIRKKLFYGLNHLGKYGFMLFRQLG